MMKETSHVANGRARLLSVFLLYAALRLGVIADTAVVRLFGRYSAANLFSS